MLSGISQSIHAGLCRLTESRKVRHVLQCPGDREEKGDDCSHSNKDDAARSVVCQDAHGDGECQDVCSHEKDKDENLTDFDKFLADATKQYASSIGKAVYLRVSRLDLM